VIDAGFRGEVMVKLTSDALESDLNADKPPYFVQPGDRIAQAMLVPVHRVAFEVAEELGESERGAGGLGSTGQ
jgi:dUTP pyrophosphatase